MFVIHAAVFSLVPAGQHQSLHLRIWIYRRQEENRHECLTDREGKAPMNPDEELPAPTVAASL
jgi:hypothetical protein